MLPKRLPPSHKPVTRRTKKAKKDANTIPVVTDNSEYLNDLLKSKKLQNSRKTVDKENVDLNLEAIASVNDNFQQNQNHKASQIHKSQAHHESSPFTTNKYQHKVPSQMNTRSTISKVQLNEPGIQQNQNHKASQILELQNYHDNLESTPFNTNKYQHKPHSDEAKSSENELFSSFGQYYANFFEKSSHLALSLNMQNTKYTNPYPTIQSGLTDSSTKKTRKDIVLQALNSMLLSPSSPSVMSSQLSLTASPNLAKILSEQSLLSKLRQAFENFRSTYNDDIAKLATGAVWEKLLKKHIDILDYNIFKNQRLSVKALITFVSKNLKIHIEYLASESREENPDYTSIVLNHVKELDYITIDVMFLATSHFQYANQLELQEK
ncbi:24173_t:CDS:10 [Gigaspora margarita]|uniref:24173_t:CDS:1 n=1 Tax=Gigaspora margarita TaxID=4874 RepID=A0ABM8W6P6_GIGMA|nr:24173_t:CDS:10 [Gigaspora margarita]